MNGDQKLVGKHSKKIRHGVNVGCRIEFKVGLIDPASHLNLDYPDHTVTTCVIIEKFEKGSNVRIADRGLVFANVDGSAYDHYGCVDYTERLSNMIEAVKKEREVRVIKNEK